MIDWVYFFLLLCASLALLTVFLFSVKGIAPRLLLVTTHASLFVNSGIAVAYHDVPDWFGWFHFLFLIFFSLTFVVTWKVLAPITRTLEAKELYFDHYIQNKRFVHIIIVLYFSTLLFPLVFPEFRLGLLLNPSLPDLRTLFQSIFEGRNEDPISAFIRYCRILSFPFLFIALYALRGRPLIIVMLIAGALYLQYIADQYIARGTIMMFAGSIFVFYYWTAPRFRKPLLTALFVATPFVFIFFDYWMAVRLGNEYEYTGVQETFEKILVMQTSFVREAGLYLIESAQNVDLFAYFSWLMTLPLPKALFGEIPGARINHEIAEIVLGLPRGTPGFFVILGGVVAESIYIYGRFFFVLHAIMFGVLIALLLRIFSSVKSFLFLTSWIIVFFAYKMPGAGVGGVLPPLINENLVLYLFVGYIVFTLYRPNKHSSKQEGEHNGISKIEETFI